MTDTAMMDGIQCDHTERKRSKNSIDSEYEKASHMVHIYTKALSTKTHDFHPIIAKLYTQSPLDFEDNLRLLLGEWNEFANDLEDQLDEQPIKRIKMDKLNKHCQAHSHIYDKITTNNLTRLQTKPMQILSTSDDSQQQIVIDVLDSTAHTLDGDDQLKPDVIRIFGGDLEKPIDIRKSTAIHITDKDYTWTIEPAFTKTLKQHQIDAVEFALREMDNGVVIAHTMGLGKTLTTLVALYTRIRTVPTENRILVLMPKTVIISWEEETERWYDADMQKRLPLHPPLGTDAVHWKQNHRTIQLWQNIGGLIFCGYETFRTLIEKYNDALQPDIVVFDEAHRLKNPETKLAHSISEIRTTKRIGLTGTPLQNNIMEYYHLIQNIRPGFLAQSEEAFKATFATVIYDGQFVDSSRKQVIAMNSQLHVLRHVLEEIVHRKDDTLLKESLPPKHEHTIYYDYVLDDDAEDNNTNALAMFHATIQHSRLALLTLAFPMVQTAINEGHKCLVFSNSIETLNTFKDKFIALNPAGNVLTLQGTTTDHNRDLNIKDFQKGNSPLFLISTKAGGLGITLTKADRVFVLDPMWNPTYIWQATARAYRFGQTKNLKVYHFVANNCMQKAAFIWQSVKHALAMRLNDDKPCERIFTTEDMKKYIHADCGQEVHEELVDRFKHLPGKFICVKYTQNMNQKDANLVSEQDISKAEHKYNKQLTALPRKIIHPVSGQYTLVKPQQTTYDDTNLPVIPYKPLISNYAEEHSQLTKIKTAPHNNFIIAQKKIEDIEWTKSDLINSAKGYVYKKDLSPGTYIFKIKGKHQEQFSKWSAVSAPFNIN